MDPRHQNTTTEPESARLLGLSLNLLKTRDLTGSKEFALLAQESDPLLEGPDQIIAICDVLLASEKRVVNNRRHDWYAILQVNPFSLSSDFDFDFEVVKRNYRRLALLLHPDKNRFPFADTAFRFVVDAWAVLSDESRRGLYDHELNVYDKVELRASPQPPPSTDSPRGGGVGDGPGCDRGQSPTPPGAPRGSSVTIGRYRTHKSAGHKSGGGVRTEARTKFWTACPYCYVMHQYPRGYEDCCLKCPNCERAYHATVISSMPPLVPGKEAYYCCWGYFPLGFSSDTTSTEGGKSGRNPNSVFPNWMPTGMFTNAGVPQGVGANMNVGGGGGGGGNNNVSVAGFSSGAVRMSTPVGAKKRGRPRKNP